MIAMGASRRVVFVIVLSCLKDLAFLFSCIAEICEETSWKVSRGNSCKGHLLALCFSPGAMNRKFCLE